MGMLVQPARFHSGGPPPVGGDYRLFRLDVSANNTDALVGLDELYAYDTVGGTDKLVLSAGSGGTFSSNSQFSGYSAANAFGNAEPVNPTGWVSGGGTSGWVRYNAPAPISLTHFGIRTMLNETGRMPSSFKLRYSDDGVSWSDALSLTGLAAWVQDEWRFWEVPSGLGAHAYWEYTELVNQGDSYCSLGACYMVKTDGELVSNTAYRVGIRRKNAAGGYDVYNALNRNTGSWYASANGVPQWIEFIVGFNVLEFGFKCKEPLRMPKNFTISGWDFTTQAWVLLNTYGPETAWSIGETRKFTV